MNTKKLEEDLNKEEGIIRAKLKSLNTQLKIMNIITKINFQNNITRNKSSVILNDFDNQSFRFGTYLDDASSILSEKLFEEYFDKLHQQDGKSRVR